MEPALRATIIFSMVGFLVNFGGGIMTPILPLYALTFDISFVTVGALIAASGLARVLADLPSGVIADRIGTKRFMMAGLLTVTISAIISALAVNYWMLLIGLIIDGIGSAIYFTTSYIGISRTAPQSKRGKHLGIFISMQFMGTTSGPILRNINRAKHYRLTGRSSSIPPSLSSLYWSFTSW